MRPAGVLYHCVRGVSAILYSWLWSISFILVGLVSTGSAQVAAHFSFAQSTVVDAQSFTFGVAVDSGGNVYFADAGTRQVLKETLSNGAYAQTVVADTTTNGTNFLPFGVAVDTSSNVYIADAGNNAAVKVQWTGTAYGAQTLIANAATNGPYFSPESVAVDAGGNVFIADPGTNVVFEHTWNGSSYSAPTLIGSNWYGVRGVAVDPAGNVYFSNFDDNLVVKVPASDPTCATPSDCITIGNGLLGPTSVAVDGNGNVYIADTGNNRVVKVPWIGSSYGTQTALGSSLSSPFGVAAGNNGNVYISDSNNFRVLLEQTAGVNFNSVPVSTISAAQTLTFTFDAAGSLNSSTPYQIVTQGAAGHDFTDASIADTCNGTASYNPGDTCTVAPEFAPSLANARYGAVSLYNSSGAPIATAYFYGIGQGPQISFAPETQSAAAMNGLSNPTGAAVDASGNLYITDSNNNAVHKYAPNGSGGYTRLTDAVTGLNEPSGIAVDGAGNMYVADTNNNAVRKYARTLSGSYTWLGDVAIDLNRPSGVAVDSNGNVYVADTGNNAIHRYALNGSGGYRQSPDVANSGLNGPSGVALDDSGNVYVTDSNNNAVHEYAPNANGGYTQLSDVAGVTLDRPQGVAVDARGNVYVADTGNNAIHQYAPNGSGSFTQLTNIGSGLNSPEGVTVDANGNVIAVDSGNARVLKEDFSDAPWLNFPTSTAVNTLDITDGPKTITVSNLGNTNLTFNTLGSGNNPSYPANFPENIADSNLCASGKSLAPGSSCDVSTEFNPVAAGANSGDINLTDNNLNAPGATQAISLSGTGVVPLTTLDITADNATRVYGTPNPTFTGSVAGAVNGDIFTETFATTATLISSVGTYLITPSVSGADLTKYVVHATPGTLSITQAETTTTLSTSTDSMNPGQSLTLTTQVKSATTGMPTGMVNFYDGNTLLGTATLTAGSATYSTSTLNAGSANSLTAAYQGDANFAASSTTSALTIPVPALDFSLSIQGAQTQTVTVGGTGSFSLQISPTYGAYPANVVFSASGLPAGASVTFDPATIAANGGAQTVAVSVQTASTQAKNTNSLTRGTAPLVLGFLLLPFVGIRRLRNSGLGRGIRLVLIAATGTLGIASLSGCGTQFDLGQQLQAQNYAITVTGTSGSTQHSIDLTLTVK